MRTITIAILLALGLHIAATAYGEKTGGKLMLKTVVEAEIQTVNAQGETEVLRVEAGKVTPGDEVIYTIVYQNAGEEPAETVVITNPVPEHMFCSQVEPAPVATITYSVDGGSSFDSIEKLTVRDEDGNERAAELADFTHIRWTLNQAIDPGDTGSVSFRAVLE